jgi:DNA replication protein DnaC
MTSQTTLETDLQTQLTKIGLRAAAANLDDFIARATRSRLSPRAILEQIVIAEQTDRKHRNLRRLLGRARIGRFRPMADFDWNWPTRIDRDLIERSLSLEFVREARNLILLGPNGVGKTMIAKGIAFAAVQAGYSVLFRTASELLADLECDSPQLRRRKFHFYARPTLLCIDEVGYLSYDSSAGDLMYEIIGRRYEKNSILITTNRAFKEWNTVFPSAACIGTMLDRLTHHADITTIEGSSFRVRESEMEAAARGRKTGGGTKSGKSK